MAKPVLQAMVLADHVYQDRSGKFIIAGTFSLIKRTRIEAIPDDGQSEILGERRVFGGPITQIGSPFLYLALVEVHGRVPLQLKLVDLSDASVLLEAKFDVATGDPIAIAECVLPMPMLPIGKPGIYSLDLLYEGEPLGSWRITVREESPPKNEAETEK